MQVEGRGGDGHTCGKDHVPGEEFVVNDRELRQLDFIYPRHGTVPSPPVELDVICGVAICRGESHITNRQRPTVKEPHSEPSEILVYRVIILYFRESLTPEEICLDFALE